MKKKIVASHPQMKKEIVAKMIDDEVRKAAIHDIQE